MNNKLVLHSNPRITAKLDFNHIIYCRSTYGPYADEWIKYNYSSADEPNMTGIIDVFIQYNIDKSVRDRIRVRFIGGEFDSYKNGKFLTVIRGLGDRQKYHSLSDTRKKEISQHDYEENYETLLRIIRTGDSNFVLMTYNKFIQQMVAFDQVLRILNIAIPDDIYYKISDYIRGTKPVKFPRRSNVARSHENHESIIHEGLVDIDNFEDNCVDASVPAIIVDNLCQRCYCFEYHCRCYRATI